MESLGAMTAGRRIKDFSMIHKIKISSFTTEIDKPIDPNLRTYVTIEADMYSVENPVPTDEQEETIYKGKLVGSTIIKQAGKKEAIIGKSKRSQSKRLRSALWSINPSEDFYQQTLDKILANLEDVIEFINK